MKWDEYKKNIKSIPKEESLWLELLADITTVRNEKGVTQKELGDLSGLKQAAVARMESPTNDSQPNVITVIKYLDVLGYKLKIVKKSDQ